MSYKALNKSDNTVYTIDYWERNLTSVTPYCPVCNEVTEIRAAGSTVMKTHFFHSTQGTDCPSIKENRSKFALLSPTILDTTNGNDLIDWTKVNIWHLYSKCRDILNNRLQFKEFSAMLEKARENKIWYYKNLSTNTLPYVLIVNFGVFPKIDGRSEEVWHIFDKSLYGDDLFLQKKISHIWRVTKLDIEKVELDYDTTKTGKHYVWKNFQSFYK